MAESEFTASAAMHRQAFMAVVDGARLDAETVGQLGRSAALLLRVAKASPSPEARVVERWLDTTLYAASLVCVALDATEARS